MGFAKCQGKICVRQAIAEAGPQGRCRGADDAPIAVLNIFEELIDHRKRARKGPSSSSPCRTLPTYFGDAME
jgi:hypothetical protein